MSLVSVKCGGKCGGALSSGKCDGTVFVMRVERMSSMLELEGGTSQSEEPGMVTVLSLAATIAVFSGKEVKQRQKVYKVGSSCHQCPRSERRNETQWGIVSQVFLSCVMSDVVVLTDDWTSTSGS